MAEVKRAIDDAMRQRIYEMWIAGYKVANIGFLTAYIIYCSSSAGLFVYSLARSFVI